MNLITNVGDYKELDVNIVVY